MAQGTRFLNGARHRRRPLKIVVCCCTYRRPHLLGHLIHCFETQDYPHREMLILDDTGNLNRRLGRAGGSCRSTSAPHRSAPSATFVALMIATDADAMVPWDGDDLVMPWALSAVVAALGRVFEADPIAVGYLPYYAFGPWDNEHLSHAVEDYARWPQRVPPTSGHVHVRPAPFSMARASIVGRESYAQRGFLLTVE
jgi:hypothetical protein